MPTDEDGLDPGRHWRRLVAARAAQTALSGPQLPEPDRPYAAAPSAGAAVAAVAERHGLWIVEDDPYGELRFEGEPRAVDRVLPGGRRPHGTARQLLQGDGARAAAGLAAGAGGACGAPPWSPSRPPTCTPRRSIRPLRPAIWPTATSTRTLTRVVRRLPGPRRDALLAGLPAALPAGQRVEPAGGRHVRLGRGCRTGYDATALLRARSAHDVAYVPGAPFFAGAPDPATLRLSFTTHTPEEIAEGLRRLAKALRQPR